MVALPPVQVVGVAAKPDRLVRRIALSVTRALVIKEVLFMYVTAVAYAVSDRQTGTNLLLLPGPVFVAACQILDPVSRGCGAKLGGVLCQRRRWQPGDLTEKGM